MRNPIPGSVMNLILTLVSMGSVTAMGAQDRKWEVEVHGGGMVSTNPAGGTAALPAAGAPFSLPLPPGGLPPGAPAPPASRRESSWYFGDGAVLVNQVYTARGVAERIKALDPVLNSAVVQRQSGGAFGFRISRYLNPRYSAEFSVDYGNGRLKINDSGLANIESSRASFITAFNALFVANLPKTVTSTATIRDTVGRQTFSTGVLNINLTTGEKIVPYATVGGGIVINSGDTPSANLTGNYRFTSSPVSPVPNVLLFNETDRVNLLYSVEHRAFVGVLGGGIKYAVGLRWGIRFDVRAHLSKNGASSVLDASPTVATRTPSEVLSAFPGVDPNIIFSNSPSPPVQSSLTGSAIGGFRTFEGSGTQWQVSIAPGFFLRF